MIGAVSLPNTWSIDGSTSGGKIEKEQVSYMINCHCNNGNELEMLGVECFLLFIVLNFVHLIVFFCSNQSFWLKSCVQMFLQFSLLCFLQY